MKDSLFYNQESIQYSKKRYPKIARSYLQSFYTRRLTITKEYVRDILREASPHPTLLEVGCADGVIIRALGEEFTDIFAELIGIDIALEMIKEARRRNTSPHATFFSRDEYQPRAVDVVVETGVVNYADVEEELAFAHRNLASGGWYILSIAGTDSLYNRLKHDSGLSDFRPYQEYDRLIREKFQVERVEGVGLFIPYLWRIPAVARGVQSIIEPIMGKFFPGLCHEKMYLLKKK